jgi:hypothetical protein
LGHPELAGFSQRLAVRTCVEPLDLHEAADYLVHHLRLAGGRPEHLVTDEAVEVLARGCRGVPRRLNQAANQALELAGAAGFEQVDVEAALEALALLGLAADTEPAEETPFPAVVPATSGDGELRAAHSPTEDQPDADAAEPAPCLFSTPRRPA